MPIPSWVRPLAYFGIALDLAWGIATVIHKYITLHYFLPCMLVLFVAFFLIARGTWEQLSPLLATHKQTPKVLRTLLVYSLLGLLANVWTGFLPATLIIQAVGLWAGYYAREQHTLAQGSALMSVLLAVIGGEVLIHAILVIMKSL